MNKHALSLFLQSCLGFMAVGSDCLYWRLERVPLEDESKLNLEFGLTGGQCAKIADFAHNAMRQRRVVRLFGGNKSVTGVGVKTLTPVARYLAVTYEGRTRRNRVRSEIVIEEIVATKVLDGVEIVRTQARQIQLSFEDMAIGTARVNWKGRDDQRIDVG